MSQNVLISQSHLIKLIVKKYFWSNLAVFVVVFAKAVSVRVSIYLSVTCVSCTQMRKDINVGFPFYHILLHGALIWVDGD